MYDAIIVGARCGGSPTAMLLARMGYRVLLVDKASFPSDIMSTHYIHRPGVARLRQWGLLERVWAAGTPPIEQITLHFGETSFTPPAPPGEDQPLLACPRRTVLDKILVDAAAEAGAEVREHFSVKELTWDGDRVTGVRGSAQGGATVAEEARVVIGADGLHSTVAKGVQAPEYDAIPTLTFAYYTYWSGLPADGAELYFLEDGGILVFPTNDGNTCVGVGGPTAGFHEFRSDIEGSYMKIIDSFPSFGERMRGAKREERYIGTNDQPNFFRRPYGPGWALVGDAGYHRDFITGLGITDAFRDAEYLTEAIDAGFSGAKPLDDAMAEYERKRNEIAKPLYDLTIALASGEITDLAGFLPFGAAMQAMMPEASGAPAG